MIRDVLPGSESLFFTHPLARILDPGVKKAPDPDPQHCWCGTEDIPNELSSLVAGNPDQYRQPELP
jgi:hypothetical protein